MSNKTVKASQLLCVCGRVPTYFNEIVHGTAKKEELGKKEEKSIFSNDHIIK